MAIEQLGESLLAQAKKRSKKEKPINMLDYY